ETEAFKHMIETAVREFPNFKVAATTLRRVITATKNDWSAILWHEGQFYESRKYDEMEILDRVGGGDSFASGLQFGFMQFNDPQKAVDYGAAHGALASTTPGDTSMATRKEVEKQISGGGARVGREYNRPRSRRGDTTGWDFVSGTQFQGRRYPCMNLVEPARPQDTSSMH